MKLFKVKERVIYLHLMGGLGNQLFQLAVGLQYSNKSRCKLVIDDSFGNFRKNRMDEADIFAYQAFFNKTKEVIILSQANEFIINHNFLLRRSLSLLLRLSLKAKNSFNNKIGSMMLKFLSSVLLSMKYRNKVSVWSATNLGFEEIHKSINSQYLIGYFQTHRFISQEHVEPKLRSLSITSDSINEYKALAIDEKPLVIHVRLGDYINEANFGVLSIEYYDKAISLMISKFEFGKLWIFSDEIETAKFYIPKHYHQLCRWVDDIDDSAAVTLEKMRLGSGYIIGNSTLSWWGSFLSHTLAAPIIAPQPWFTGMEDPKDLIPNNWIKINR